MTWDEVALDKVKISGEVLVIDELADVAAPLTAVKLAKLGAKVRLLTKWPMIGMETAAEVYLHWIMTYLYEADVEMITDHAVKSIRGRDVEIANLYQPSRVSPDHRRRHRDGDVAQLGKRDVSSAARARIAASKRSAARLRRAPCTKRPSKDTAPPASSASRSEAGLGGCRNTRERA